MSPKTHSTPTHTELIDLLNVGRVSEDVFVRDRQGHHKYRGGHQAGCLNAAPVHPKDQTSSTSQHHVFFPLEVTA
jgi:hypothetical protein